MKTNDLNHIREKLEPIIPEFEAVIDSVRTTLGKAGLQLPKNGVKIRVNEPKIPSSQEVETKVCVEECGFICFPEGCIEICWLVCEEV